MDASMIGFIKYSNHFSPLTREAVNDLTKVLKMEVLKKGDILNREGLICRHLFFVDSGLVKHYYYSKGKQYITKFFCENNFFIITDSFLNQAPAEYTTVALEDTTLVYINYNDMEALCKKHHSFETFIRIYISKVASITLYRFKTILNMDATERYNNFLSEYQSLQQRISLGDIASYLGMSQVSLSRIRAKK